MQHDNLATLAAQIENTIADINRAVVNLTFRADRFERSIAIVDGHVADVLCELRSVSAHTQRRFDAIEARLGGGAGTDE